jgi:hypothetical protein
MAEFPCKECFRRSPTCHSTCDEYLEAKKKLDMIREMEHEECLLRGDAKRRKRRLDKRKKTVIWKSPRK